MGNSRWSGSLISGGGIYAAGTTYFNTQRGSAATKIPDGVVRGATGFYFEAGDAQKFACGTVVCGGGASVPIKATGLTTIGHVFMQRRRQSYSAATTGYGLPSPAIANGTRGSFYPISFKTQAAGGIVINSVAATWSWFAVGV
jgi:hypothetical protein